MSEQQRRVYEIRRMYLPRLLKWDDRNFMAFGVEGRYPFLDHRLIELALSFTPDTLYSHGWIKEPLRRGMSRDVARLDPPPPHEIGIRDAAEPMASRTAAADR